MKIASAITLLSMIFLCACSKQPTTNALANDLADEVVRLPEIIKTITDESSAKQAVDQIRGLEEKIVEIASQSEEGEFLSSDERIAIDEKIQNAMDETEYLMQKLSNRPELLIILEKPLTDLATTLSTAEKRMKGEE